MALVDKALVNGADYQLTGSGDLKTVEDDFSILQAAQNRCLSVKGTWLHDDNFGTTLFEFLKGANPFTVTDEMVSGKVKAGLMPMLNDKRIDEVNSVQIVHREESSLYVEVKVTIGTKIGEVVYRLNF